MEPCLHERETLGLTLVGGVASAQDQKSDKDPGGVLDVLRGIVRGDRQLRGNVVAVHDSDVVVRGDDGRTYVVNTSGLDANTAQSLQPGQAVSVTARSAGQGGILVGSAVKAESSPTKNFQTIEGTVESVNGTSADGGVDRAARQPGRRVVVAVLNVARVATIGTVDHLNVAHAAAIGVALDVDERRGERRVPASSRLRAVGGEWIPGAQDRRRPDAHDRHDRGERRGNRAR